MRKGMAVIVASAAAVAFQISAVTVLAADAAPAAREILGQQSNWRWYSTWRKVVVSVEQLKKAGKPADQPLPIGPWSTDTAAPPADWIAPNFDASSWPRGRMEDIASTDIGGFAVAQLALRTEFRVDDPSAVKSLTLSAVYRGGIVVYLNGEPVARNDMPDGPVTPDTLANAYPDDAFVMADGSPLIFPNGYAKDWPEDIRKRIPIRNRSAELALPVKRLVKGVNTLAITIQRAPYHAACESWFYVQYGVVRLKRGVWPTCAPDQLSLRAEGNGIVANAARPKGIQIFNADVSERLSVLDWGNPVEPLHPIRITAARNGVFHGEVVVSSDSDINKLSARIGDLRGEAGSIPASAVRLRVVVPDASKYSDPDWYDGLAPTVPTTVKVHGKDGPAMAPLWVTVRVPADAAPGLYRGELALSADGLAETRVPVELDVRAWTIPSPGDFHTVINAYSSPTSIAMQYGVEMWSEKHWQLVEHSMQLLGELGNEIVHIPVVRQTQLGNDEGIVTWVRKADGSYDYDLSVVDRYLALVRKHIGSPDWVVCHVWHAGGWGTRGVKQKNEVTVRTPDGKIEAMQVPEFGTEASKAFWKPAMNALKARLAAAGLANAMTLGTLSDNEPPAEMTKMFDEIVPGVGWHRGCHRSTFSDEPAPLKGGSAVSCWEYVYGPKFDQPAMALPKLPAIHAYQGPGIRFMRGEFDITSPMTCRTMAERGLYVRTRGVGRMCLDFWPVVKGRRGGSNIYNRWPHSTCSQREPTTTHLAWPGPDGAEPTVRYEMLRESVQQAEAMVLISRGLLDHADVLGQDLADRCRKLFEDRIRFTSQRYDMAFGTVRFTTNHVGLTEMNRRLWDTAAEVRAKLRAGR